MNKKQVKSLTKAGLVLLVLSGASVVEGDNVFTDDFKGDGMARFVIEAENYSSRSTLSTEGWWEVDGGSQKFIEGPGDGKDAPTAKALRAVAGDDVTEERSGMSATKRSSGLSGKAPAAKREARGNYMVLMGTSPYPIAPTDSSYDGAFVDYRVAVQFPGEYRLYARWLSPDANSDSFYAHILGPDGTVLKGAGPEYFVFHSYQAGWRWDDSGVENTPYASLTGHPDTATWRIKRPGEYTIRVAQREVNTALDALVFQTADLPSPNNQALTESQFVDKPVENREILAVRVQLQAALAQRREALQTMDDALAREALLYEALDRMQASGKYGDLSKWNVVDAKQKVGRMIETERRSRKALDKATEQLETALTALGWTPPPPPEPVAYWSFDEGEGTAVRDSAGDNNGSIHGAKWTDGRFGKALRFDGVDDYVEVGDDPSLRFMQSSSFTISLWAMPASDSQGGHIISKMRSGGPTAESIYDLSRSVLPIRETSIRRVRRIGVGGGRQVGVFGYQMAWSSPSSMFGFAAESSWKGAVSARTGHDSAPAGGWYHVAGVYSDNDIRVYLNGELKDRKTFDMNTGSKTPDKNLVIGALSRDSTIRRFFSGKIDEVCIYDGALSDTEVRALYQRGL